MTIALPARAERRFGIDVSKPVLYLFAVILCALIVLPLSWLLLYSLTDAKGAFTLANFYRLFTESSFIDPLITTFILATSSAFICCAVAAPMGWLVARTDLPFGGLVRALVTASFVTPPFLGAIAWELLAAPNSGLLNKLAREWFGMTTDEHLFNIYTLHRHHLRDLLLHVSVRVRAGRQFTRSHAGRTRGRFLDPRRGALVHRAARDYSAGVARVACRRAGRLPAGDDVVRFTGDSGAAGRLSHDDHQNLEPVPIST